MKNLILVLSLLGSLPSWSITKADLLSGSQVPEKRNFPLSQKIGPCQDFHAYVCDEVETSFKMPDDRNHWVFSFTDGAERLLFAKKTFFKSLGATYTPATTRSRQLFDYYKACMNPEAQAKDEKFWVEKQKEEILKIKTREELAQFTHQRLTSPYFSWVDYDTVANQTDPKFYDLMLIAELMNLPENSYYDNKDLVADFKIMVQTLFTEAGLDQPAQRAEDVVSFEIAFAKIYPKPAELRERYSSNTYWKKEKWLKAYPDLGLDNFFKKLNPMTKLRNIVPESMLFLQQSLKSGSVEQLKNVFLFNSLKPIMDEAYPKYFQAAFNFKKKHLGGAQVRPPQMNVAP